MKFLNSNYGYANFAKGAMGQNAPSNSRANPTPKKLGKGYSSKNPAMGRGDFAPSVFANETGPQPMYGPKQAESKLGNAKNAIESKAQGYGAKGKNMLARAGKFVKNNKVGVGLAAAGALGAVGYGAYRKMRSDKGKKRGSNNN